MSQNICFINGIGIGMTSLIKEAITLGKAGAVSGAKFNLGAALHQMKYSGAAQTETASGTQIPQKVNVINEIYDPELTAWLGTETV